MGENYIDLGYRTRPGSLSTAKAVATITGATQANPVVITATAHSFSNGDIVYITGVVGMTEINSIAFTVASAAANTFALSSINGSAYTAYTSGGTARKVMSVTNDVRLMYDDTLKPDRVVDAVQRAKEALAEILR